MFDIEKAKAKGMDSRTIEILQSINENTSKRELCHLHDFEQSDQTGKYRCKNCGCSEDGKFVAGYNQGMEHGRNVNEIL
jgi:lipopolysaccharide biosynthesis regulator YciM